MNSFYWILATIFLVGVKCNPVTELSTDMESTVLTTDEVSTKTEFVKELAEDIETSGSAEVTTSSEELVPANDCSDCLNYKYMNHYYAKGCKPIFDERCNECPKSFNCSQKEEVVVGRDECLHNGIKYKVGEAVSVDNPCKVCQCGYGFTHTFAIGPHYSTPFTTIHCITVECPEHFGVHRFPLAGFEKDFEKLQNCYNIYEKNECCAVSKKCLGSIGLIEVDINEKFCEYNHKKYRIGEKIYPNEDKCKVCICDQNWETNSTINNSGCYNVNCNLEIDRQLKDGCVPIYHENTCCPVEYYCPEKPFDADIAKCSEIPDSGPCGGQFKRFYFNLRDGLCHSFSYSGCGGNINNFRTQEECEQTCSKYNNQQNEKNSDNLNSEDMTNYCILNEIKYEIGEKLDIRQKCVDCECRIPPEFTCIQKSCPTLPSNDCKVTYSPHECCPLIDCNYNKSNDRPFNPMSCPTPLCEKGCLFETYPDKCPNCVCEPNIKEQEVPDYDLSDI